MKLDTNMLTDRMVAAGKGLGEEVWGAMKGFAAVELRKIAVQIVAVAENAADFTPAGAKLLLELQVQASVGVIVAMTEMVMLAVQRAINAVLAAVREMVNGALPFPLL